MTRALMPRPFQPALILMDPTPDGCAELLLEVNGHLVASTVLTPIESADDRGWYDRMTVWWHREVRRRC